MTQILPTGPAPAPVVPEFNFSNPQFRATKKALFGEPEFSDLATLEKKIAAAQAKIRGAAPEALAAILSEELLPALANMSVVVAAKVNEIHLDLAELEEDVEEALDGGGNLGGEDGAIVHDALSAAKGLCETVLATFGAQLPDAQKAMIQAVLDKCKQALPIVDDILAGEDEEGDEDEEDEE